jgi:alpha-methylacyl-CoA racemase
MSGTLRGIRIVELAGLAPAPFAAMMLADQGATVIRVEREDRPPPIPPEFDILARNGAETIRLDLKSEAGAARVREIARDCDGLIEGFRPGGVAQTKKSGVAGGAPTGSTSSNTKSRFGW